MEEYLYAELTKKIIGAFFTVRNILGYGFLEKVYENALKIELEKQGYQVNQQKPINVYYEKIPVGEYYADLVVNDEVILELKSVDCLCEEHEAQLINYLRASEMKVGLLLNFGKKVEVRRKISSRKMERFDERQLRIKQQSIDPES